MGKAYQLAKRQREAALLAYRANPAPATRFVLMDAERNLEHLGGPDLFEQQLDHVWSDMAYRFLMRSPVRLG